MVNALANKYSVCTCVCLNDLNVLAMQLLMVGYREGERKNDEA